jgi:glutamine amidotransferase
MSQIKISIIKYGSGNLHSVQKILEKFGALTTITDNPNDIANSDVVVFPGQGSNDTSMRQLREKNLVDPIRNHAMSGKYFLGICLGLQLLFETSEEGIEPCLNLIPGKVHQLPENQKRPHMGWNNVTLSDYHPLFNGINSGAFFYFVHSYYAKPSESKIILGTTTYGIEFSSVISVGNIIGVQFHPEKSGFVGLKFYENFIQLVESKKNLSCY